MSKTLGIYATPRQNNNWSLIEMREHGNETTLITVVGEPKITNSSNHSIIIHENGRKELYDYATGNFRSI